MRPLRLRIRGFGPFARQVDLDFRALGGSELFGIYGPTGGGKTSILDALCFALFGQSSGDERKAEHLRSQHAGADEETAVELLFAIGDKRYFVRRAPEQELAKKRGAGTTKRLHEAYLFDASALDADAVAFPDQAGQVLAERKVREVDQCIQALLGYTAAQFRQVIVLPQGRFRELLTAPNEDRSKILRQLFATGVHERLGEALKARKAEIRAGLERTRTAMQTILAGRALTGVAELDRRLADKEQDILGAATIIAERADILRQAERAREAAHALAARFAEFDAATAQWRAVLTQEPIMAARERELAAAERARKVLPAAAHAEEATAVRDKALADHRERERRATAAAAAKDEAAAAFASSQRREPERERLRAERDRRRAWQATWDGLAQQRRASEAAREAAAAAADQFARCERARNEAERRHQQLGMQQMEIVRAQATAERLSADVERLTRARQARQAAVIAQESQARSRAELAAARERQGGLDGAATEARRNYDALHHAFVASAAARLAHDLKPGEPCPVCGGTEHPAPARATHERLVSASEIEAARASLREAETAANAGRERVARLAAEAEACATRAREREREAAELVLAGDLEATLAHAQDNLAQARATLDGETANTQALTESEIKLAGIKADLEEARHAKERAAEAATNERARMEAALAVIPADARGAERLACACQEAERALAQALADHERARQALAEAEKADCAEQTCLAQAAETLARASERAALAEDALRRLAAEQDFATPAAFQAARRGDDEIEALRDGLARLREQRSAAEDRLKRAEAALNGAERPDLPLLDRAAEDARRVLDLALERKVTLESERQQLRETQIQYAARQAEFDRLDQDFRQAALLADVADGRDPNSRRIKLIDWVLAAYLDDVLAHANQRFWRMSKGRFRMVRKDSGSGRRTGGLDIAIDDAQTGQERDAATLSGGESFLAALSLALGLSDVVQAEAGGIHLDAIFIDEGFGHLDEEALDAALNTLVELSGRSRSVGIISHVEEVKRMVPIGFEVRRATRGSEVHPRLPPGAAR